MSEMQFRRELAGAQMDAGRIAALMRLNPNSIDSVFLELSSKSARVKFGCSKALVSLSEKYPELLHPHQDKILKLLDGENRILKWNAIAILGNMAAAGQAGPLGPALRKFYRFLASAELIAANHAIAALGKIGRAFPKEQARITLKLLELENAPFETDECRNIAIGKCVQAMGMFLRPGAVSKKAREFARRQTGNRRKATAEKAKAFLRCLEAPAFRRQRQSQLDAGAPSLLQRGGNRSHSAK